MGLLEDACQGKDSTFCFCLQAQRSLILGDGGAGRTAPPPGLLKKAQTPPTILPIAIGPSLTTATGQFCSFRK